MVMIYGVILHICLNGLLAHIQVSSCLLCLPVCGRSWRCGWWSVPYYHDPLCRHRPAKTRHRSSVRASGSCCWEFIPYVLSAKIDGPGSIPDSDKRVSCALEPSQAPGQRLAVYADSAKCRHRPAKTARIISGVWPYPTWRTVQMLGGAP